MLEEAYVKFGLVSRLHMYEELRLQLSWVAVRLSRRPDWVCQPCRLGLGEVGKAPYPGFHTN